MTKAIIAVCSAAICVMILPAAARAEQQPPKVITLQDAVNIALTNNKGLVIAREQFRRSRSMADETRALGLPNLGLQAQTQRIGPVPEITIPGSTEKVQIASPTSITATALLIKPIDLNGRLSLATEISELASVIQELNLARAEQQLVFDVQNAYYNILRAEGQRDVAQAAVDSAQERLKIVKAQFEVGALPKFDVTRAEVEVANRKQALIAVTSAVDVSKAGLLNIMGFSPTEPIQTAPVTVQAEPLAATAEQYVGEALARRPEALMAEGNVRLQQRSVKFARRERLPSFAATAGYNYTAESTLFQPNKFSWAIGLNATLPIYEGGAIKARIDESKSDLAAAQAQLDQTRLDIALDVKAATLNLSEAYQRIQTTEKNVAEAEEALRLAQVRFQSGISIQVEVSDAETALTQAGTNFVNAKYDYATALARLQRATATQPQFAQLTEVKN